MTKVETIKAIMARINNIPVKNKDNYYQLSKSVLYQDTYYDGVQIRHDGKLLIWYSKDCNTEHYTIAAIYAEKVTSKVLQYILNEPFEL